MALMKTGDQLNHKLNIGNNMGNIIKLASNEDMKKRIGKASAIGGLVGGGLNMTRAAFNNKKRTTMYRTALSDAFVRGAATGAAGGAAIGAAAEYKKKKDEDRKKTAALHFNRFNGALGGAVGAAGGAGAGMFTGLGKGWKASKSKTKKERAKEIAKNVAKGGAIGAAVGGGTLGVASGFGVEPVGNAIYDYHLNRRFKDRSNDGIYD